MGKCDLGHGCSKTCDGGCSCVYFHQTGDCWCQCLTSEPPREDVPKVGLDDLVDISMSDVTITQAIKHLKRLLP